MRRAARAQRVPRLTVGRPAPTVRSGVLGKAKWDSDVLGDTVAEAMTIYNGYYGDFGSSGDKGKELDLFRKKTTSAAIIEKLVERVKELNDA